MGVRACEKNKRKVMKSLRRDNKSKITGVSFNSKRNCWRAEIQKDGKYYFLGLFRYRRDAIVARLMKEYHLYGKDAPQAKLFVEYNIGD